MDPADFRFRSTIRVRNYEIDWQGIVHNSNYLLYFETGRLEYLERIGVRVDFTTIRTASRVVVARNEVDYLAPARYGDTIDVLTRVARVGTTSFTFEGILHDATSGKRIAENVSVHVWVDDATDRPVPVPDDFRRRIAEFEGSAVAVPGPGKP
jgi:acyl-CoA thioester hydrolase